MEIPACSQSGSKSPLAPSFFDSIGASPSARINPRFFAASTISRASSKLNAMDLPGI